MPTNKEREEMTSSRPPEAATAVADRDFEQERRDQLERRRRRLQVPQYPPPGPGTCPTSGEPMVEVLITTGRQGYCVPKGRKTWVKKSRGKRWHEDGVAKLQDAAIVAELEQEQAERQERLQRELEEEEQQKRR